jgi:GT2 family glycosyltransferase
VAALQIDREALAGLELARQRIAALIDQDGDCRLGAADGLIELGPRQALSNPYTGVAAIFSSRLDRQVGYREHDDGRFDEVTETDRACGAAMLVPRHVLEQVGLFDADLVFYSEDVDWSLRARDAGHRH